MWKAAAGAQINLKANDVEDDDWDTDPDFVNNVDEQQQRWGSTTIAGSGRTAGAIDMEKLRKETEESDAHIKQRDTPNTSYGYGGKFGVQTDRMDQSAVGHDYVGKVEKHASQKDYSTGFGGKFGVQTDRVDKSAVSWDHKEKLQQHASQKDYNTGFGGKFGVQTDRQDKSAMGWDHVEKIEKHESQKDYSKGFGGKFGVQTDRQDKSAVGWDHHEASQKHESQTDHNKGFGGKFGVQTDRMDKSAATFDQQSPKIGTNYARTKPEIGGAKPSELRAKFENLGRPTDSQPAVKTPTSRGGVQAKAALFSIEKTDETTAPSSVEIAPKQLDQSKMAFLTEHQQETVVEKAEKKRPGQLDKNKLTQFHNAGSEHVSNATIKEELEQLKNIQQEKQQPIVEEVKQVEEVKKVKQVEEVKKVKQVEEVKQSEEVKQVKQHTDEPAQKEKVEEQPATTPAQPIEQEIQYIQEEDIVDTGLTAIGLYDYQASAEDEISFDPDDIITHVEMIDEGWWRGMCKGRYGLFPANYVQLQQQ